MDSEGQVSRRITISPEGFWSRGPSWSPDDKWLAFVRGKRGGDFGEIYVVSVDGGKPIKVTNTNNQVYDWRVTWGE